MSSLLGGDLATFLLCVLDAISSQIGEQNVCAYVRVEEKAKLRNSLCSM